MKYLFFTVSIHSMDSRRIDLNLLVALDALIAERNVTRAAARLHLSQPALSARLNRLRRLFRDPLLVPARRGMIPTARALELQNPLRRALEGVHAVVAEQARFDPVLAEQVVNIAASDYIQYAVLLPLTVALQKSAPRIRLAWRAIDGSLLADQAERGEIDLAIMTPATAPPQLRSRRLFEERYVCIARRKHPKVRRVLDLETFVSLEHVVVSPRGGGFSGPADAALQAHHRTRRVALSVASFLMVPEIVAASDLIALVPERLARIQPDRLIVREPPVPVPGFGIGMVWHERNTAHPAHRWLRETIAGLV
jgi:DNA-binding transcriptional LysR family regulator